jgi:hypothetical protein
MSKIISDTVRRGAWIVAILGSTQQAFSETVQHEITSRLEIDSDQGKVSSEENETKFGSSNLRFELGYGYFINDNVEPYFEIANHTRKEKLGDLDVSSSGVSGGFGMLFNLPVGSEEPRENKKGSGSKKSEDESRLLSASFIPYAGLILSYFNYNDSITNSKDASPAKRSQSDLLSKLKIGVRYTLFPHVALNSSLKISIQNSTRDSVPSGSTAPEKPKGATQKISLEADLITLSLLF